MSPYDAYEQARKEYAHLPRRMVRSLDLIARRALAHLGVNRKDILGLLTTYPKGKTRDRVVAAYEHHLNRTMNKTKERQAMKYSQCSSCKNEPYMNGVRGPCATCVVAEGSITPTNWLKDPNPRMTATEVLARQAQPIHICPNGKPEAPRDADCADWERSQIPPGARHTPIERALATQVGGAHYKDMPIQPVEFITKNGLGFVEGSVIKYVSRWRKKGGVDDLRKARHFLDLLIEMEAKP